MCEIHWALSFFVKDVQCTKKGLMVRPNLKKVVLLSTIDRLLMIFSQTCGPSKSSQVTDIVGFNE